MKANWFYRQGEICHGPFSANQLRLKAVNGELRPQDFVWREDMPQPVQAQFVPTLVFASQTNNLNQEMIDE